MYTKAQAIEQVYLRVNGGKTTAQNTIKREDIELYLLAAIAWAWGLADAERFERMARAKRYGLPTESGSTDLKIAQYLTPLYDERTKDYYVEVNKIPNIGGHFFEVSPVVGNQPIYKVDSKSELYGLEDVAAGVTYCYYLQIKGKLPRIYFWNLVGCEDCELEVTTNFDFSQLSDDDYIQAPPDKEILIIDKCVEFFNGTKTSPEDNVIDQNDNRNFIENGR